MRRSVSGMARGWVGIAAMFVGARPVHAQASDGVRSPTGGAASAVDTVRAAPARHLAGRARVDLEASAGRIDKGELTTYAFGASVAPFVGEHLQVGIAPNGMVNDSRGGVAYHAVGSSVIANYVFGGDGRWRGYVGGFGAATSASYSQHTSEIGAQTGALFFLTPALAIRGELRYRDLSERGVTTPLHFTVLYLGLDSYAFGAADSTPIAPAGFGTVDVTGYYTYERLPGSSNAEVAGTFAPYLTRWAQLGATGLADGFSDGVTAYELRGFGRLYLPLSVRTQPFAEGYAVTTTFGGEDGGLTSYGAELGVRRMVNANVALDVGVQREQHPALRSGPASFHQPGGTALVIGMMTRIGHAR